MNSKRRNQSPRCNTLRPERALGERGRRRAIARGAPLFVASLIAGLASCQNPRTPPGNTPTFSESTAASISGGSPISTSASGHATSTSSSSSGSGGAAGYVPTPAELDCANAIAHNSDCEACMYVQMEQSCAAVWQSCSDNAWCESGFRVCAQNCAANDDKCLTACFDGAPQGGLPLLQQFDSCVCSQCTPDCP